LKHFFRLYWQISLLQRGPQDVPAATLFFLLMFVALQLSAGLLGGLFGRPLDYLFLESLNALAMALLVWVFLYLRSHAARFNQTMAAIYGIGILFNLSKVGLRLVDRLELVPDFLISQVVLLLLFWQLTVLGHILRLAMNIHIALGILLAIFFLFVELGLGSVLDRATG